MRQLPIFLTAVAAIESLFFAVLAPLLPAFEEQLMLSKGQAGLLVAMYPIGWGVAALPVGLLAPRIGVKRSTLAGLAALALTSAAFGLVDSYETLLLVRFLQGAAATLAFAAGLAWLVLQMPRTRRGEMIGLYAGAAAAGSILGPVVGGLASVVGRGGIFLAVGAAALSLAVVGTLFPSSPSEGGLARSSRRRSHFSGAILSSQWLVILPGLLLGTIFVLAPLELRELGWDPLGVAATFLAAAATGVVARPLIGRWADRHGLWEAMRLVLLASVPLTILLSLITNRWLFAAVVACAVTSYGVLWGPAMARASSAYEDVGVAQVLGFALMSLTSGIGLSVGAAAGGRIAQVAGDGTAYGLAAAACLATVAIPRFRSVEQTPT